jgi:Fe-coproporphyrin III synthase
MGIKDIGFGITVSDNNSSDMLWLYQLSKTLKLEFATATFHNSYYFHKDDNLIKNKEEVIDNFRKIIEYLLKEKNPKSWYRAFFNLGLINYINGGKRMLPCEAGLVNFFIEPYGEVYPCNGMEDKIWKESMGNIYNFNSFEDLWLSEQASKIRGLVRQCPKNCWMIGSAAPVMKKYLMYPTQWVLANKARSLFGKEVRIDNIPFYNLGQDSLQGDLDYKRIMPLADIHETKPVSSLPLIDFS